MKVIPRYCDTCGIKIPTEDLKSERALSFEGKFYCRDCKEEMLPHISRGKKKKKRKKAKAEKEVGRKSAADRGKGKEKKRKKRTREKKASVGEPVASGKSVGKHTSEDLKGKPSSSSPPMWVWAAGGGVMALLLLLFAFWPSSSSSSGVKKRKSSAKEIAKREKQWIEEVENFLKRNPNQWEKGLRKWEILNRVVKTPALKEKVRTAYSKTLQEYRKTALLSLEKALENGNWQNAMSLYLRYRSVLGLSGQKQQEIEEKLQKLEEKKFRLDPAKVAPKLIQKAKELFEQGEHLKAIAVLRSFDTELYQNSPWSRKVSETLANLEERLVQIAQKEQAERYVKERWRETLAEVDRLISKNRFAEAMQLLRDFVVQFPQYKQQVMAKVREINRKQNEAFEKELAKYEWQDLIAENQPNLFNWMFSNYQKQPGKKGFSISRGVMRAENDYGRPIFLATGYVNWQDYLIEYEARSIQGKTILMVRYNQSRRRGGMFFTFLEATPTPSGWYKIQWLIQGQRYLFRVWQGSSWGPWRAVRPLQARPSPTGAVGFLVMPGHAFEVRRMRIKVLRKGRRV